MASALSKEIEAYKALLPEIKSKHGDVWALVAHQQLVEVFEDFDQAAKFAEDRFPHDQVLIRHTGERRGMAPFIVARG
jgi:hypothetical protein